MSARLTLLLVLIAAALGAVLWWTDQKPPIQESATIAALDGRSLRDCARVRWQFANLQPIELARGDDGVLRLAEPIVDLASAAHVRVIVHAWDTAQLLATAYEDDAEGRKETGLDPPEMTFRAVWPDGHTIAFDVGAPGPLGNDRFLRRDGKIWLGGAGIYEGMRVNVDDLRERAVFRTTEPQCTELRVEQLLPTGKREVLHLQRADGAEWRLVSPYTGRAEPNAATSFVIAVLSLRADEFLPGTVRQPKGEPVARVLVRGAFGEEALELWEEHGIAFGLLPGRTSWFQTNHNPYAAAFRNAAENLRSKALVPFANTAEELAEAVIDPGQGRGDRIRLVRAEPAAPWRLVEPVERATDPTACAELVQAINNLYAIEFVEGASAAEPRLGLGPGRLLVAVRGFAAREATNLWLGARAERTDAALVHACRADEPGTVVLVPDPAVELLRRVWTVYCARQVLRITVPVERIEVKRGAETVRVFEVGKDGWVEAGGARRAEVGDFATDVLRDLRARAVVDVRSRPLGEPQWSVSLQRANGDELRALRAWDRGAEQPVLVQPDGEDAVAFELGARDAQGLRELWR